MGCCIPIHGLDHDRMHSVIVLQVKGESVRYHGTTERSRLQTLGYAELVLTEDGIYSQVISLTCCQDRGFLHIPLHTISSISEQTWFNGLYRLDHPHLVITYNIPGKGEFQAGWQMNDQSYVQWKTAIETLIERPYRSE